MPDRWTAVPLHYKVGQIWNGSVRVLASFGAFIRLADGADALVELPQMTDDWRPPASMTGLSPADYVSVGEAVRIRVSFVDEDRSQMRCEFVEKRSRS